MKKPLILASAMLALTPFSQAAGIVYSTDFNPTDNPYTTSGAGSFTLGGAMPDVIATTWFGSSNKVGISGGNMNFANDDQNRYRGIGVWLDTSVAGWEAGTVNVKFDVTAFTANANSTFTFETFAANGVDGSNSVSMDLHGGNTGGAELTNAGPGSPTIAAFGSQQEITAAGNNQTLSFTYNGTDQFIGLVFAQVTDSANSGAATFDNLSVTVVPEPSAIALLGFGAAGRMLRRRRA